MTAPLIPLEELRLGQMAVMQNICTQMEVDDALARKRELSRSGSDKQLGEILVEMGYLTPNQLRRLLNLQKTADGGATIIGNYRLLDKIGEGGMGAIYRAEAIQSGKIFALKVLQRELAKDTVFLKRFEQEIRAVFSLDHPNIVKAYDVGHDGGNHYLVMEYVQGEDAFAILEKRGKLPEPEALAISRQIASALQHVHESGLVHRDIKPENILVTPTGIAKLADMGLAVKGEAKLRRRLTATGIAMGTPSYLSPEQIRGEDIDIRSDLYGLGATMYELVTGKVPFEGESARNVMDRHLEDSVPSPREVDRRISEGFCHIVEKLMAKDREDRYRFPYEVMLDIDLAMSYKPLASKRVPRGLSTVRRFKKRDDSDFNETARQLPVVKSPSEILRETLQKHRVYSSDDPNFRGGRFRGGFLNGKIGQNILFIWLALVTFGLIIMIVMLWRRNAG